MFEYMIAKVWGRDRLQDEVVLNLHGENGWELVAVIPRWFSATYIFKKSLPSFSSDW